VGSASQRERERVRVSELAGPRAGERAGWAACGRGEGDSGPVERERKEREKGRMGLREESRPKGKKRGRPG
jgi:hypothetical protein